MTGYTNLNGKKIVNFSSEWDKEERTETSDLVKSVPFNKVLTIDLFERLNDALNGLPEIYRKYQILKSFIQSGSVYLQAQEDEKYFIELELQGSIERGKSSFQPESNGKYEITLSGRLQLQRWEEFLNKWYRLFLEHDSRNENTFLMGSNHTSHTTS
jgi:hypothetical protein